MIRIGRGPRGTRQWHWLAVDIAAQTALGFGLALIAIGVFIPWELL